MHDQEWGMVYNHEAPYEVLCTNALAFDLLQRLKRFARYFDLVYNSGNFRATARLLLWGSGEPAALGDESRFAFHRFLRFSDWLYGRAAGTSGISLDRLAEFLFDYLVIADGIAPDLAASTIVSDYRRNPGRQLPRRIESSLVSVSTPTGFQHGVSANHASSSARKRQTRHQS